MNALYQQFSPSQHTSSCLESIWVQESAADPLAPPTTILPNGRIELVIHYGERFSQIREDGAHTMSGQHIVGQQHRPVTVKANGHTGVVIARFHAWAAATIIPMPLPELTDELVELDCVWPADVVSDLLERIHLASTPRKRARTVDDFVARQIQSSRADPAGRQAIELLNVNWGGQRIEPLARAMGFSRRQLGRRFLAAIGTTPKRMSRMLRAQKALSCFRSGWHTHDIVASCGYSDQSHLIHDMVAHTGKSPSALRPHAGNSLQQHFNTADINDFCGQAYL